MDKIYYDDISWEMGNDSKLVALTEYGTTLYQKNGNWDVGPKTIEELLVPPKKEEWTFYNTVVVDTTTNEQTNNIKNWENRPHISLDIFWPRRRKKQKEMERFIEYWKNLGAKIGIIDGTQITWEQGEPNE